ncbi:hypothetical protein DL96DRAFT_1681092 [Flagelloscypha sp. PMI_526]|nr:hypothetical protein DL96DRAFT_1681092 [Flagelloscypha sp. PMI_526]
MVSLKSIALATVALGASSVLAITPVDCYGAAHGEGFHPTGLFSAAGSALLHLCMSQDASQGYTNNVLAIPSCVAAYISQAGSEVAFSLGCQHPATNYNGTAIPHLDFNIYAQIVGDCAWNQPEACPITQQNIIDFIYRQIQQTETKPWPSSVDVVIGWYKYMTDWTKTGNTIPYHNFDDFLHYSYSTAN